MEIAKKFALFNLCNYSSRVNESLVVKNEKKEKKTFLNNLQRLVLVCKKLIYE